MNELEVVNADYVARISGTGNATEEATSSGCGLNAGMSISIQTQDQLKKYQTGFYTR